MTEIKTELNKLRLLLESADTKLKLGVITQEEYQETLSVIDTKLKKIENQQAPRLYELRKKKWFKKEKNEKES